MGGMRSSNALQLGETEAQILARHGAPVVADHGRNVAMYSWAGWSVRLDFQGGKVAKLTYKKTDAFGPEDFGSLLQANGGIARWRESSQPGAKTRQWARDDGAVATFDTVLATSMTIQSGEAATVLLQQAGPAAPGKVAAVSTPAKTAPAPEFFPDPQATIAKSDPKLSEITVPVNPRSGSARGEIGRFASGALEQSGCELFHRQDRRFRIGAVARGNTIARRDCATDYSEGNERNCPLADPPFRTAAWAGFWRWDASSSESPGLLSPLQKPARPQHAGRSSSPLRPPSFTPLGFARDLRRRI